MSKNDISKLQIRPDYMRIDVIKEDGKDYINIYHSESTKNSENCLIIDYKRKTYYLICEKLEDEKILRELFVKEIQSKVDLSSKTGPIKLLTQEIMIELLIKYGLSYEVRPQAYDEVKNAEFDKDGIETSEEDKYNKEEIEEKIEDIPKSYIIESSFEDSNIRLSAILENYIGELKTQTTEKVFIPRKEDNLTSDERNRYYETEEKSIVGMDINTNEMSNSNNSITIILSRNENPNEDELFEENEMTDNKLLEVTFDFIQKNIGFNFFDDEMSEEQRESLANQIRTLFIDKLVVNIGERKDDFENNAFVLSPVEYIANAQKVLREILKIKAIPLRTRKELVENREYGQTIERYNLGLVDEYTLFK